MLQHRNVVILFLLLVFAVASCRNKDVSNAGPTSIDIAALSTEMSNLMIHDVTNPPLASRFYAYAYLAGYEVVSQNDSSMISMHGVLNEYPEIDKPNIDQYSHKIAAVLAVLKTASKLQPSGKDLLKQEQDLLKKYGEQGFSDEVIEGSVAYADSISKAILRYAKADKYNKLSDLPRYQPVKGDGYWYPTPPAFLPIVEPHFNKVRSFTMDSANVYIPLPPVAFDTNKTSPFYGLMKEVHDMGVNATDDQKQIAAFWDCNPFAVMDEGHLQIGVKKISPGAHWMGIAGIACQKAKMPFNETMQVHAVVAFTLMDAFICCWDEKMRSNRIRPETAIRRYIDPSWKPLLQTPPFPEYLSGHSVISTASAEVLTSYFGDGFAYTDSVEVQFGLGTRTFSSFREAANEAAISRLYGGIHFMDAIEHGKTQGRKVAENVIKKLKINQAQSRGQIAGN
jgi:hypothetical protein